MALTDPQIVKAANVCLKEASGTINMLKKFAFDASEEFASAGATVKVPVASVGTISAFNKSTNNFEKNDGSITWETITLDTPVKATWELDAEDLLKMPVGSYINTFGETASGKIQRYISAKIGGLFNTTDITASETLTLTLKGIATLRGKCVARPADTVLMLDSASYNELLSLLPADIYGTSEAIQNGYIDKAFGFSAVVEAFDLPSGVKGALLPKSNLVIVSRNFQVADESGYSEFGYQADPDTGFSVTMMKHCAPATGSAYLNAVALFGAKVIKKDEVKLLV